MNIQEQISQMGERARRAARVLSREDTSVKNRALLAMADALERNTDSLMVENGRDLEAGRKQGLAEAMLERLTLTPERIAQMAEGVRQIVALPDPVGTITGLPISLRASSWARCGCRLGWSA